MTPQNENKSFLDRGTIIALVLVMIFWMGWSWYMNKKYPQPPATATAPATPAAEQTPSAPTSAQTTDGKPVAPIGEATATTVAPVQEQVLEFNDDRLSFQISSKGMGLRNINVKSYQTRDNKPIILGEVEDKLPFSTYTVADDQPIHFAIEQKDPVTFVGHAVVNGATVEKTLKVNPENYVISTEIKASQTPADFKGFNTYLSEKLLPHQASSFLAPASDVQDFTYMHDGSRYHEVIHQDKGLQVAQKNVNLAALSSHYFTLALVDSSPVAPDFVADIAPNSRTAVGRLTHQPVTPGSEFTVKYAAFTGPKSFSKLEAVDPNLTKVINYGMFAWIAKPLLWLLNFLNSFIHNYGLSIIVLTIIVRFLVLPFNVYSYRSMKVMQKIQPEMQRLREKYKNDPQTMNREVMDLMRKNKANPLGGCLPMLLQLPIFIALYSVLGQSIELYRAPFMLWIQDLSAKDAFYVLPVLMGITMFIQQKITPTTMDPAQAKILMWMPVIFAVFMLSLPSGLTLYIFISTLFGIIQQYIFMKEKNPEARVSNARA